MLRSGNSNRSVTDTNACRFGNSYESYKRSSSTVLKTLMYCVKAHFFTTENRRGSARSAIRFARESAWLAAVRCPQLVVNMHVLWFRGGLIFVDLEFAGAWRAWLAEKVLKMCKTQLYTRIATYGQSHVCFGMDQWRSTPEILTCENACALSR